MKYKRTIAELESHAVNWWPSELTEKDTATSIVPLLLKTQDDFLKILSLAKSDPYHIFDLIKASKFPANLFLKHLCVLADYGGEPIQRLGRTFNSLFDKKGSKYVLSFIWESNFYEYLFQKLPIKNLGNKKLYLDGSGLLTHQKLTGLYKDMIILMLFGSTSTASENAGLEKCEIGTLIGKNYILTRYVTERYIHVSRITGGAKANSLGQLAQKTVVEYLNSKLGSEYHISSNGTIPLNGYDARKSMPFDIVVSKHNKKIGIEISFQVTTNSTIERKAGQAKNRQALMHNNGYNIAYILDGAGNFQRQSAISTICEYSDCTIAYSEDEFDILINWIGEILA